ncbi:Gfo/Idh/MocA family oxidoreductase [Robertkochia solimangrovi]|uniref:Gfo/Idh/MocA family oxidoreductase n=1 Tax=Robertkochia solimangrovi TaxID=2213046 RepID=UPI00117C2D8F|nr:Gfo/Idh/MocA family oxidoreductase [Robertkochia solimangrovi]TRZ43988.1 oxidoreductase [Robertkochia solimangrovi]
MKDIKKINTVILGYGFSGSIFFAPFLHLHEGFTLKGAWERSEKKIQKDYSYVNSYESLAEILADESIDLVVVNTPIDTHYTYAKEVLKAGKHVIVEKAFTNTAAEAKELCELAKNMDLHLIVYQNRRFDSDFLTAKKILKSGKLGPLKEVNIAYDIHHPQLREGGEAHTEKPVSGGEFNNRGSHITDQALNLFGLPTAVFADFATFRKGGTVEDYVNAILFYPDKRVKLHETNIAVRRQDAYVFHGLEGSFFKSRSDMQEDLLLTGAKPSKGPWCAEPENEEGHLYYFSNGERIKETIPTEIGNYYNYFEAVYRALVYGEPVPVTGWEGYHTMLVMDAVRKSVNTGSIVEIDLTGY